MARAAARVGLVPAEAAEAVTRASSEPAALDLATVVAKAADAGNPVPPLVRVLQAAGGERGAVAGGGPGGGPRGGHQPGRPRPRAGAAAPSRPGRDRRPPRRRRRGGGA